MAIDDKIRDEKLLYDINREAAKIPEISTGKIQKYQYLTGEEILPCHQRKVIEQTTFTYSLLRKALEKQIKTIEDQGKKQRKAIEDHRKQLVESNELIKNDFNINRNSISLEEEEKYLIVFVEERSSDFWNLEKRINCDN